jgi:diguanylate cyclase (GGDEF)-like protein
LRLASSHTALPSSGPCGSGVETRSSKAWCGSALDSSLRPTRRSSGSRPRTIANHRVFQDRLAHEWARAERDGSPLSLLMIDVDAFKAYNDGLGHQAGDSCLRQVAQVVADHATRPGDLAARYGGEEFAVILAGTDDGGARAVADKLRAAVEALAVPHPGSPVAPAVTVSIGLATARPVLGGAPAMPVQGEAQRTQPRLCRLLNDGRPGRQRRPPLKRARRTSGGVDHSVTLRPGMRSWGVLRLALTARLQTRRLTLRCRLGEGL